MHDFPQGAEVACGAWRRDLSGDQRSRWRANVGLDEGTPLAFFEGAPINEKLKIIN